MKIGKYIDGLYGIDSDIDLVELKHNSHFMYNNIKEFFQNFKSNFNDQGIITTKLYSQYNLLLYPFPILHDLYFQISNAFHLAIDDYYGRNIKDRFFMQCWLNYYKKGEFIDWHGHQPENYLAWHGFVCVDTEPDSYTSYRWPKDPTRKDLTIDIPSKNGLIVMGISNGDIHKSSEWQFEDRPRITIAFDIVPAISFEKHYAQFNEPRYLNAMRDNQYFVNHWIPI